MHIYDCWLACSIRFQQNWIFQSACCFELQHSWKFVKISFCFSFLSQSPNISSSCSHISQHTSEMVFFISLALQEYSLGHFFDFSFLIESDNFTARCWRRDHLLINLGHTGISFSLLLLHRVLLSTHSLLSKIIPDKKHRTTAQLSLVCLINLHSSTMALKQILWIARSLSCDPSQHDTSK